jgi:hypothetical protein
MVAVVAEIVVTCAVRRRGGLGAGGGLGVISSGKSPDSFRSQLLFREKRVATFS